MKKWGVENEDYLRNRKLWWRQPRYGGSQWASVHGDKTGDHRRFFEKGQLHAYDRYGGGEGGPCHWAYQGDLRQAAEDYM